MTPADPAATFGALGGKTWPEVEDFGGSALLVLPIGSLEQHGPHLPLDTDTRIAAELAHRLAVGLGVEPTGVTTNLRVAVAPALAFGASGEHADFPGTLSVGTRVLADCVVELVRSSRVPFAGVVIVSAHGGNAEALAGAVARCRDEGDQVLVATIDLPGADAHAGRAETSMVLALDPTVVRVGQATAGRTEPLEVLLPDLRRQGVRAVSESGVLGDPTGATEEEGRRLLQAATDRLVEQVCRWWTEEVRSGDAGEGRPS